MQFDGQLLFDFPTYRRVALAPLGRKAVWTPLLGLAVVALGVVLLVVGGTNPVIVVATLFGGVLCTVMYEAAVLVGWSNTTEVRARPWHYQIGPQGVGIQTPQANTTVGWEDVERVKADQYVWLFELTTGHTLPVPRTAFAPHEATQIDGLLPTRRREIP